jgi:hypothetical protein
MRWIVIVYLCVSTYVMDSAAEGNSPDQANVATATIYTYPMTLYEHDEDNYVGFVCRECQQQYYDHWQERWDEYNAGRMCLSCRGHSMSGLINLI